MDLKNKHETTTKNHQASIQNLEAKFDRFDDKRSGRPSGSLPSNTQPNPKGISTKPYQPPQARNEHVNAISTRSGKSYDLPVNPNDQQNDSETPINFDSDDEDDEPTPQPKPKNLKPLKETPTPKPYKPKLKICSLKLVNLPFLPISLFSKWKKTVKFPLSWEDLFFTLPMHIDVIDEILEEDFDALLDEGMTADEKSESESDTEEPPFEKKQDAKPCLIRWILLLQEFDIKIKDRKGIENVAADHLSRIENEETSDDSEVDDNFPGKTLMEINTEDEPWFADFANYFIPKGMTYQQKKFFFSNIKHYFWEEPYLFKVCSDGMIRRCISELETQTILDQCHHGPTGRHYGPNTIAKKVLDSGFYWPTIIKEAHTQIHLYEACQKTGNVLKRDEMPLNNIQVCEIFDIWGINFIGPFPKSYKFEYILVAVDYVSKWAEAQALPTNDARVVITFLKKLFCHFGMPKALISDRETHFCNKIMEKTMKRYGVNHQFSTSYHPQTGGQVVNTNRALKRILEKTVKDNPAI
ncbi:reverse transcriptase domain-containing protein [Tanacetum coccineum]